MITIRPRHQRGSANYGWLDTHYSFSFAEYYDPQHMGVSVLRVINDDRIAPISGFDTHPHRDMEIISYLLEGTIEHRDSMGEHGLLHTGEVQVMSAGSGIQHSEHNPSSDQPLHLLQIWITPNQKHVKPRYQQQDFSANRGIHLIVSPDGGDGPLNIHQDAFLYQLRLEQQSLKHPVRHGRSYYLQVAKGALSVNGQQLQAGDGATIIDESELCFSTNDQAEALLFDLP